MYKQLIKHQFGASLLEVLITVLVVSIGLLGFASLQIKSASLTYASNQRQQAINLAQDISESIFVNGAGASAGQYTITALGTSVTLPETSVAMADINRWVTLSALFSGDFLINDPVNNSYHITICWNDKNITETNPLCNNLAQMDGIQVQASRR